MSPNVLPSNFATQFPISAYQNPMGIEKNMWAQPIQLQPQVQTIAP